MGNISFSKEGDRELSNTVVKGNGAGKKSSRPRRGTITKPLIMQVAAAMFQEKGYDRSSLEDIAKILSITKPSLYYHFNSKEDILIECIRAGYEHFQGELADQDNTALSGKDRVKIFLKIYGYVISNDIGVSMIIADDRVMSHDAKKLYNQYRKIMNNQLEERLEAGARDGSLRKMDFKIASNAIFAMFNGIATGSIRRAEASLDGIIEQLFSFMFDGISI